MPRAIIIFQWSLFYVLVINGFPVIVAFFSFPPVIQKVLRPQTNLLWKARHTFRNMKSESCAPASPWKSKESLNPLVVGSGCWALQHQWCPLPVCLTPRRPSLHNPAAEYCLLVGNMHAGSTLHITIATKCAYYQPAYYNPCTMCTLPFNHNPHTEPAYHTEAPIKLDWSIPENGYSHFLVLTSIHRSIPASRKISIITRLSKKLYTISS